MNTTLKEVTKAAKLISLPEVYFRLKSILEEPDFSMAEVAVIISHDPAITVRLLRMVNSSLYGFRKKIETVSHAVSLLGTVQVHDIVLASSVVQAFKGMSSDVMDMQKFWQRSVYCAVAARQLAALCRGCDKERLFVAGLLHDIGHLVMYQEVPDQSRQAMRGAAERNEPIYKIERELLGFDYAEIGGELMLQWSLSESLWETTKFHIEPEKAVKYPIEVALVHLGVLLAKVGVGEGNVDESLQAASPIALKVTGLTPEDCNSLREQVETDMQEVMMLIVPPKL
ncbi:HDOD domain-containing protein [Desulforhopalus sp. IMCC35007]|uniref:HDOD domain-containing protein n=1 Tax=Desulforhopalus sp. IMCC35007 TaxID=2569543 RepID=UPI0010AE022E|nr:HDOD domain-containing protein [Desulforhopalus sp. IMCC35007]TKB07246.1 HDOD domain-containing protein [Desulforhopalus sp. IMCC35007]